MAILNRILQKWPSRLIIVSKYALTVVIGLISELVITRLSGVCETFQIPSLSDKNMNLCDTIREGPVHGHTFFLHDAPVVLLKPVSNQSVYLDLPSGVKKKTNPKYSIAWIMARVPANIQIKRPVFFDCQPKGNSKRAVVQSGRSRCLNHISVWQRTAIRKFSGYSAKALKKIYPFSGWFGMAPYICFTDKGR